MIDINLDGGAPTINNEIDLIIQQIDMLFDTAYREVHGAPGYGTRYEDFLYNLNISNAAIEYQIQCDLNSLQLFGFVPSVEVSIYEGTLNDIILCKVTLTRNDQVCEKTYKIQ